MKNENTCTKSNMVMPIVFFVVNRVKLFFYYYYSDNTDVLYLGRSLKINTYLKNLGNVRLFSVLYKI